MKYSSVFNRKQSNKKFFSIKNGLGETEILLYNEVTESEEFCEALNKITSPSIKLRINSPGGDVFHGLAIYNSLKNHPAKVETHIDGLAASIGSVIALAGDRVYMSKSGHYMIHNVWGAMVGDSNEFRKTADRLDKIGATIANIYADRTGHPVEKIREWQDAESWFGASEALQARFIDEITGTEPVKAKFDLSVYSKAPADLQAEQMAIVDDIRKFEAALRDEYGLTHSQAKKLAAGGFPALSRDETPPDFGEVVDFIHRLKLELKGT